MYTRAFSFRFFPHIDHRGIRGRVLWALQQVPVGQSFHVPRCAYAADLNLHPNSELPGPWRYLLRAGPWQPRGRGGSRAGASWGMFMGDAAPIYRRPLRDASGAGRGHGMGKPPATRMRAAQAQDQGLASKGFLMPHSSI